MKQRGTVVSALCLVVASLSVAEEQLADGEVIAKAFQTLSASTRWRHISSFEMKFDTFHPQGMTIAAGRFYVSSVEVIDRAAGEGRGHLFEADVDGGLLRRITLGEGAAYHPGGIDFDGREIWVPVAEYRPDSHTVIYAVDPQTMKARKVFEFADHLGGIVRDVKANVLIGNSWGSRRFYRWALTEDDEGVRPVDPKNPLMRLNGSHYVDYQDAQWLPGTHWMLCGGLKGYRAPGGKSLSFGGVELVDTSTLDAIHQVPVALWSKSGRAMTQNPLYVTHVKDGLRFYFMPDDSHSTVYAYDAVVRR